MIPLSEKDAEDLRRQQLELEDERRKTSITGKSTVRRIQGPVIPGAAKIVQGRNGGYFLISYKEGGGLVSTPLRLTDPISPYPKVPGLGALAEMMKEVPGGAMRPPTLGAREMPKTPQQRFIMRVQTSNGTFADKEVQLNGGNLTKAEQAALSRARRAQNNIYFSKGQVIINGIESPQVKAVLDGILSGKIPPPPPEIANQPVFTEEPKAPPRTTGTRYKEWELAQFKKRYRLFRQGGYPNQYEADGVRITNSLINAYRNSAGVTPKQFTKEVFVFGSNEQGIHGKGAALTAVEKHGAVRGQGVGLQGSSYAIPTKKTPSQSLPLPEIKKYVDNFIRFAKNNPDTKFNLTAIGTGLAGYKASDIAPMFADAPDNVVLPDKFKSVSQGFTGTKEEAQARLRQLEQTKKSIGLNSMPKEEQIEYKKLKKYLGKATTLLDLPEQEDITKAQLGYEDKEISKQSEKLLKDVDKKVSTKIIDKFQGEHKWLSNFYNKPIRRPNVDGSSITYQNAEAAYQAEKTLDPEIRKRFANLNGAQAKALGRKIKLRPDWNKVKWDTMREIVYTKFQQDEGLRAKLIATGEAELIEGNNWGDKYWGVDSKTGQGKNYLGRILMSIRKEYMMSMMPGDDVIPKTKPEPKVKIQTIGKNKLPGLFVLQDESTALVERQRVDDLNQPDGGSARSQSLGKREFVYNKELTYNAIKVIQRAAKEEKFAAQVKKQGGIRIGKFFVSVAELRELSSQLDDLARRIPKGQQVIYDTDGTPRIQSGPATSKGLTIMSKTLGPLSIIAGVGDLLRLSKEWSTPRKVPIS